MADSTSPTISSAFENDFEKVDNLISGFGGNGGDSPDVDQLVSSSDRFEEDLYSADIVQPSAPSPLINFGEESPTKPAPVVPVEPLIESMPSPVAAPSQKPQVSSECWVRSSIDPRVLDLIYWRDVKKTGVVFGSMLVLLLSLALFSVLSVVAYLSLSALTVTVSFVIYKKVMQAVQKTGEGHPFKQYLDMDITIPDGKVHQAADIVVKRATETLRELRRLFLVEDLVDSVKFGLLLWVLTYLGAAFNGMTLIILAITSIFTIPKFYEVNKVQIDEKIALIKTKISVVLKQVQEKLPLPGKKAKTT